MPPCSQCNKSQGRLNPGDLCKSCFNNGSKNVPSVVNDNNSTIDNEINSINSDIFTPKDDWNISHDFTKGEFNRESMINDCPTALLASLYSQVEFLRSELTEKNFIIRNLMNEIKCNRKNEVISSINNSVSDPDEFNSPNFINSTISNDVSDEDSTFEKKNRLADEIIALRKESHDKYMRTKTGVTTNKIIDRDIGAIINAECTENKYDTINSSPHNIHNLSGDNIGFQINEIYSKPLNIEATWRHGTTLIAGDSMLNGIDESKLRNTKVRVFPGASIEDLAYHLTPLLRKKPSTIILHIATNNCVTDDSDEIMVKLTNLKLFILNSIDCKVIFSSLIIRSDNMKANMTTNAVNEKLKNLGADIIDNSNIDWSHLGRKGHHMTPHGTGKLAVNFIKTLKSL